VRVREGVIVAEYSTLVRPRVPISAIATKITHIDERTVAGAPYFEQVWPDFRDFCGDDVLVAHNGHAFDFQILKRMSADLEKRGTRVCAFDSLVLARELHAGSCRLPDLAHHYRIDPGRSHDALHDARTLAQVVMRLEADRIVRARKTALVSLLDLLAIALALAGAGDLPEDDEARRLLELSSMRPLGRYSDALDFYRAERDALGDESAPTVDDVIGLLGGHERMMRIRAERTANQRHPGAMTRLRRLLAQCAQGSLETQITEFLQLVALSARQEGPGLDRNRVNLLTLHATKGLEFSRVCIVGAEDSEIPGGSPLRAATDEEVEEARRLLYVGMTRAKDRLILTRAAIRAGKPTGGHRFLDEMGLVPIDALSRPPGTNETD
jgi:DNA polymerase III epsilon subunit-like protein